VACDHDLEFPLRVQVLEFLEPVVLALLQDGLVAVICLEDEVLGGVVLVLELAQGVLEGGGHLVAEGRLGARIRHELLKLLLLRGQRLLQTLAAVLVRRMIAHDALITDRDLKPNTIAILQQSPDS